MPRYVLGPVVQSGVVIPAPPTDPETPPPAKVDQDIRFDGIDAEGYIALFTLPAYDPETTEPVVRVHLCAVRPPVPDGAGAAYFMASEDTTILRTSTSVTPEPGADNRVGVALPDLTAGTWDVLSVLEYPG